MQAERRLNKRKILDNRQQPNLIGTHDHVCLFFMFLYFLSNLYWGGTKPHAVYVYFFCIYFCGPHHWLQCHSIYVAIHCDAPNDKCLCHIVMRDVFEINVLVVLWNDCFCLFSFLKWLKLIIKRNYMLMSVRLSKNWRVTYCSFWPTFVTSLRILNACPCQKNLCQKLVLA